jgi:hypothetical protein
MASTISAGTTAGTALNLQSDTTGNLAFKTGASAVTAMTLDTNQNVTFANNTTYSGTITATAFSGNGVALTAINASNVTSGTLATAQLPTVPVANGGTGLATLTANNVLIGNGTSNVGFVAPGSNGNVLTSNGTAWTSAAAAAGYVGPAGQVFTSSGTFTIPTGITKLKVTVVGGGGGGGQSTANQGAAGAGGGGGGGTSISYLTSLTPGGTLAVTIGGAGSANGGTGGTSSVASGTQTITTRSASGGSGGGNATASETTVYGGGGDGGIGSSGTINFAGTDGNYAYASGGASGGSSSLGGGAKGNASQSNGNAGRAYGGGGSGTYVYNGGASPVTVNGGAGFAGAVIFEW